MAAGAGRTLRIVNYAVNGGGVGHLTRLTGISRWLQRFAGCLGLRAEIIFLTSSEADGMLLTERMPAFKIPSPTAAQQAGLAQTTYLAVAKQWVWHSLALLQPDLFVVDTWPMGAFGELVAALDLCRARAFVYRPVADAVAAEPEFQAMLPLYQRIIVPEHEHDAQVQVPEECVERVHYAGPVMIREAAEMRERTEARDQLGIASERLAIYISAGGGGDPTAEQRLLDLCAALSDDPDLHLVVGAGPLYRGRVLQGQHLTWLSYGGVAELLAGIDLAICGAGYNTFCELMHAGVPTVFMPLEKQADEQRHRAERAVAAGAATLLLPPLLGARVEAAVAPFKDPARRAAAAEAARALVPRNHARDAAADLLGLLLPAAQVQAAVAAVDDTLLATARQLRMGSHHIIGLLRALMARPGVPPAGTAADDASLASDLAVSLATFLVQRQIPRTPAHVALEVLAFRHPRMPLAERAEAAMALLGALAPFADWGGAVSFLRLAPLGGTDLGAACAAVVALLRQLRQDGQDLYAGIAKLSGSLGA